MQMGTDVTDVEKARTEWMCVKGGAIISLFVCQISRFVSLLSDRKSPDPAH